MITKVKRKIDRPRKYDAYINIGIFSLSMKTSVNPEKKIILAADSFRGKSFDNRQFLGDPII